MISSKWRDIEDALCAWIASVTGIQTTMLNRPRPAVHPGERAIVLVDVPTILSRGATDETRWEDPGTWAWGEAWGNGPGALEVTVGVRELTVRIRVESWSQTSEPARHYTELIRDAFPTSAGRAALAVAGLSWLECLATTTIDSPDYDQRVFSISFLDVRLGMTRRTELGLQPVIATVAEPELL